MNSTREPSNPAIPQSLEQIGDELTRVKGYLKYDTAELHDRIRDLEDRLSQAQATVLARIPRTPRRRLPRGWGTRDWQTPEYRHAYAEDFLFSRLATQIKVIREQRGWTQADLAARTWTKQPGIAIREDVNYTGWSVRTLLRLAHAFDCWLHVSFESYRDFPAEEARFGREGLRRDPLGTR